MTVITTSTKAVTLQHTYLGGSSGSLDSPPRTGHSAACVLVPWWTVRALVVSSIFSCLHERMSEGGAMVRWYSKTISLQSALVVYPLRHNGAGGGGLLIRYQTSGSGLDICAV